MTKEEHPPPTQREPSPALARMHSMGVSTTSEGVDNFARVSGSFMRSTTKNPLLNNDNTNTILKRENNNNLVRTTTKTRNKNRRDFINENRVWRGK